MDKIARAHHKRQEQRPQHINHRDPSTECWSSATLNTQSSRCICTYKLKQSIKENNNTSNLYITSVLTKQTNDRFTVTRSTGTAASLNLLTVGVTSLLRFNVQLTLYTNRIMFYFDQQIQIDHNSSQLKHIYNKSIMARRWNWLNRSYSSFLPQQQKHSRQCSQASQQQKQQHSMKALQPGHENNKKKSISLLMNVQV